jgi:spoIIIJ-associated protein
MSSFLEFDAKTVELAVQKASESLNIPIKKLKHDIISYGSTGIFGLVGTKKARIRVSLPDTDKKKSEPEYQTNQINHTEEPSIISDIETEASDIQTNDDPGLLKDNPTDDYPPDQLVEAAGKKGIEQIINLIEPDATITVKQGLDRITFSIHSENPSMIIGKRGQTIEAIQYILEKIINKQTDQKTKVEIDIGDYLKTKHDKLANLATRMATKAKRTGKPATISKMNAYNRRIIHLALKDDNEVKTVSIGKNFLRKLVIFPNKKKSV